MVSKKPPSLKPKQELGILQNQFLLLFLKYGLGFRCSESAFTEAPLFWEEKKHLLIHCFFHAVFNNSTDQNPQVNVEHFFRGDQHFIEISSTGNAATFHQAIGEYCFDVLLKEFLRNSKLDEGFAQFPNETFWVEKDQFSSGSRIIIPIS